MSNVQRDHIVIGSRESKLAVAQSMMVLDYIRCAAPALQPRLLTMKTTGDLILHKKLDEIGGKGLFVKELDMALSQGETDLSVHSLKDMPMEIPPELPILGYSKREDPRDVLILPKGAKTLSFQKAIGCSSLRRKLQLAQLYPQAKFEDVRGNVLTRLEKLDAGVYGALVLAAAGIKRLGLENRISRYFSVEEILPAAGQGILAIQGRADRDYGFLDGFFDEDAKLAAVGERAFVAELQGGCFSPAAAFGQITQDTITLTGLHYSESAGRYFKGSITGPSVQAQSLGNQLAQQLLKQAQTVNV